ncbi:hypothetical protein D8674_042432 [Pyrus ussuriensis x Pyrus communis]|uniref:Uncharacterized protein n=1 Tax=Pyrus ussuriensis x Pyrus communis TaxID=2448454 RepID=A0A5N5FLU2_9ROSA|nr:hypothetical protein D8674_042432 [Pyrus ussuriensis x Pyrus communis]
MTKMKSLSSVGLGLSVVFGCLFLALIAELYYLLWWKKRFTSREIDSGYSSSPQKEIFYMFCWRRSTCTSSRNPTGICASLRMSETLVHEPSSNNLVLKSFEEDDLDAELMRLQNAGGGPPRHLFTIVEETKEDLEQQSEDGGWRSQKGSRSKSLSDLLVGFETPYLTPLGSPTLFTPPLTPPQGFSPLFESKSDAEFNRLRSSPPPKFKFLQVAEEKLRVKLQEKVQNIDGNAEEDGSFITIIVDKNNEKCHSSSTSQVLPLVSSPSGFRSTIGKKPNLH